MHGSIVWQGRARQGKEAKVEVGRRIREERDRAGLSQEAFARKIFVTRQTVSNWETGKTYPDVQSLLLMSNLFDVSVDSLVKGDVEAMEKQIENYELERFKMNAFSWAAVGLFMLAATIIAVSKVQGVSTSSPIYLVAGAVMLVGLGLSLVAEKIKAHYDIQTMREVKAFLEGTDPDQIVRERKVPKAASILLKLLVGAAFGAIVMAVAIWLFGLAG